MRIGAWLSRQACVRDALHAFERLWEADPPLLVYAQAVKVLQRVIPSWRPLELDPCEECEGTLEQSVAEADKLKVQQGVDKVRARSNSAVASRLLSSLSWPAEKHQVS
jgi:hypothetical protein